MSCNQLHDRWALPFPRTGGVLQTPTGRLAYGRRRHNQQLLTLDGDDAPYDELRTSSSAAVAIVSSDARQLGEPADDTSVQVVDLYWLYGAGSPQWTISANWLIRAAA
jgi:hypothetical protein